MALKKITEFQRKAMEQRKKEEEVKKMQMLNDVEKEQGIEKVEEIIEEDNTSNINNDPFFKEEVLNGDNTPIQGLELELEPEQVVEEGKYRFSIKNVGIENGVITKYGIKNKAVIEFNISGIINDQEEEYILKQKYNISNSHKSKFYKIYSDLTGNLPIGKINLRDLLGIKGICEVKYLELDNGDEFPEIVNVNREIEEE